MKRFAAMNWRTVVIRVLFLVAAIALLLPGVSLAGGGPVPDSNVLLVLGSCMVGLGLAGRKRPEDSPRNKVRGSR